MMDSLPEERPGEAPDPGPQDDPRTYNVEAEQAFIGTLLLDNSIYDQVLGWLKADHFYDPVHGRIYEATAALIEKGKPADPIVLKPQFEGDEGLARVGGPVYLLDLMRAAPDPASGPEYAKIILEQSQRRDLVRLALDLERDAAEPKLTPDGVIDSFVDALSGVGQARNGGKARTQLTPAQMLAKEDKIRASGAPQTVATGLEALDNRLTGGLTRSGNTFLIGGTGMGKTAAATNIAFNGASLGLRVFFWSREMTNRQMLSRLTCLRAAQDRVWLDGSMILSGHMSAENARQVSHYERELAKVETLLVETQSPMTAQGMRARVRQAAMQLGGLDMIIIDYLGQVGFEGGDRLSQTEKNYAVSQNMIELVTQYNAAGLLLGQVTRQLMMRDNKRPKLGDSREGSRVEDDATAVISPYRPLYWLKQEEPDPQDTDNHDDWKAECRAAQGKIEMLTLKNRDGETGIDKFTFSEAGGRIGNIPALEEKGGLDQEEMAL